MIFSKRLYASFAFDDFYSILEYCKIGVFLLLFRKLETFDYNNLCG